MILKNYSFKKEKGSKVKILCKQVRDQRNGAQVLLDNEINPKAFAIPILTAIASAK